MRALLAALTATVALTALPQCASAQWMWKDDAGHVVVSDQPPPASVPDARIMKSPSARPSGPVSAGVNGGGDEAKPKSLADQDMEFKKRQKDAADAAKKQQEETAKAQEQQQRCQALKGNLNTLQSGVRLARTDDSGNRYFVDDAQRQAELQRTQDEVSKACSTN